MINTASKLYRALCSMAAMLALVAGIASVQVLAASNGIYTATATPHYRHPGTGKIEDSGGEGSAVLGQSMTDSATFKQALVEVDENGNTYITVRLKLSQYTKDHQFQVDGERNGTFTPATVSIMQENLGEDTTDYRMQVPSENAVIRCNMYVIPMGREVIFYITVSDLQAGSGDFVTSITVNPETQAPASQAASSQSTSSSKASQPTQPTDITTTSSEAVSSSLPASSLIISSASSTEESSSHSQTYSSVTAGIQEYDANGNLVSETAVTTKPKSNNGAMIAVCVIGGVIVLLIAGGLVWYFCFFKKKSR